MTDLALGAFAFGTVALVGIAVAGDDVTRAVLARFGVRLPGRRASRERS